MSPTVKEQLSKPPSFSRQLRKITKGDATRNIVTLCDV
jgi:hypothetical protein